MRKEVKIGLIGIVALAMLFFGINYLKGVRMFNPSSYYYVEYTDINGLTVSSPVFASGYKIGTVRDIQYNHANPGHVVVEVEREKFEEGLQYAYRQVVKKVNIPGFRKGKAPRAVLEAQLGEDVLYEDAVNHILPAVFTHAVNYTKVYSLCA